MKHLRQVQRRWPAPDITTLRPTEDQRLHVREDPLRESLTNATRLTPSGSACAHCEPLVLEADGREVTPGEEGLLYIAGRSVFHGYWNRPVENNAAFLPRDGRRCMVQPATSSGGIQTTDSSMRPARPHGQATRYCIELGEIERGLYLHPRIHEAAVIAMPDADGGVAITAFLSPQDGAAVDCRDEDLLRGRICPPHEPGSLRLRNQPAENVDRQGGLPIAQTPPGRPGSRVDQASVTEGRRETRLAGPQGADAGGVWI